MVNDTTKKQGVVFPEPREPPRLSIKKELGSGAFGPFFI